MNIYSWNIYFRNGVFDRALEFIQSHDFDIFCLQEVTDEFLEQLKQLPYEIAVGQDIDRLFPKGSVRNHLVILSRHPILEQHPFSLTIPHIPLRTRLFVQLMRILSWSAIENNGGLSALIAVPGMSTPVQVFSLHILLSNPKARALEFEEVMRQRKVGTSAIVCGDFNLIDSPRLSILNWILGGTLSDAFLWRRERADMEKTFASHDLVNPLRGQCTHPFSGSQLDHILVSRNLSINRASVLKERPGSDHRPIMVEIA